MSIWQKPKPKAKRNKEKLCPTSITGRINTHTDCRCNCSRCRISEIESATAEGTEAHSEPPTVDVVGFLFLSFSFSRRSRKQKVCSGETACLPLFPLLPTGTTVVQQTLFSYAPRSSYSRRRRRTASASISVPHEASSRAHAYTHTLMHGHFSCGNSSNNTDTDLADQHQQHIPRRCTQTLSNEILLFPLSLFLSLSSSPTHPLPYGRTVLAAVEVVVGHFASDHHRRRSSALPRLNSPI